MRGSIAQLASQLVGLSGRKSHVNQLLEWEKCYVQLSGYLFKEKSLALGFVS